MSSLEEFLRHEAFHPLLSAPTTSAGTTKINTTATCGQYQHDTVKIDGNTPMMSFSVHDSSIPKIPFRVSPEERRQLLHYGANHELSTVAENDILPPYSLGFFSEPRLFRLGTSAESESAGGMGRGSITTGVDIFCPQGTLVHSPSRGYVAAFERTDPVCGAEKEDKVQDCYRLVVTHPVPSTTENENTTASYFTVYEPLVVTECSRLNAASHVVGMDIDAGDVLGCVAKPDNIHGWPSYLTLQLWLPMAPPCSTMPTPAQEQRCFDTWTACLSSGVLSGGVDPDMIMYPLTPQSLSEQQCPGVAVDPFVTSKSPPSTLTSTESLLQYYARIHISDGLTTCDDNQHYNTCNVTKQKNNDCANNDEQHDEPKGIMLFPCNPAPILMVSPQKCVHSHHASHRGEVPQHVATMANNSSDPISVLSKSQVYAARKAHFGQSLSIAYDNKSSSGQVAGTSTKATAAAGVEVEQPADEQSAATADASTVATPYGSPPNLSEPGEKGHEGVKEVSRGGGGALMLLRGYRHYMYDEIGREYLDAYNNVPHVGHSHPRIQRVASDQLGRINTNTRYIHPAQTAYVRALLSKFPQPVDATAGNPAEDGNITGPKYEVAFFVNSGAEANELALRLARAACDERKKEQQKLCAATQQTEETNEDNTSSGGGDSGSVLGGGGVITLSESYFGGTTGSLSISPYKFNKPGGIGQADWVSVVESPLYRFTSSAGEEDEAVRLSKESQHGTMCAARVDAAIAELKHKKKHISAFISEMFPSVAGQIIPPKNFYAEVYEKIRREGGVCIADEVQTGLGRLGSEFNFAFQYFEPKIYPDIVVLGKPMGNGHPIAAVVTSRRISNAFAANGIEYFSTFGASTLSCRIGKEVLDIVASERLHQNAGAMGVRCLTRLRELQRDKYPEWIVDVRGVGLFIGVELGYNLNLKKEETMQETTHNKKKDAEKDVIDAIEPATDLCRYIILRMQQHDHRILIGSEGPHSNVLKIRPPLTITAADIDRIVDSLDSILTEWTSSHS